MDGDHPAAAFKKGCLVSEGKHLVIPINAKEMTSV
jgi:hypothetical protein